MRPLWALEHHELVFHEIYFSSWWLIWGFWCWGVEGNPWSKILYTFDNQTFICAVVTWRIRCHMVLSQIQNKSWSLVHQDIKHSGVLIYTWASSPHKVSWKKPHERSRGVGITWTSNSVYKAKIWIEPCELLTFYLCHKLLTSLFIQDVMINDELLTNRKRNKQEEKQTGGENTGDSAKTELT